MRSAERGLGILLVEHDMALVRQVCRNIYVLDFGQLIFEGTPAEMLASPVVRSAYLGSEGVDGPARWSRTGRVGDAVLELEQVTAGYGETVVLRDVTISVPDSKVVALLGPNGAGKTTTLRTASGLIKPMEGRVLLDGEDVTGKKPYALARRGLCHLPEGHGIFPSLTVKENIVLHSPKGREQESLEMAADQFPALATRLGQQAGKPQWRRTADALAGEDVPVEPQDRGRRRGVPRAVAVTRRPGLRGVVTDRGERHVPAARRAVRARVHSSSPTACTS